MAQKPGGAELKGAAESDLDPIPVAFWRTAKGKEPVREWLKEMPKADRTKIGEDLATLQYGWPVGMPLWELRSELSNSRQVRILLAFFEGQLVLLHGFMKKMQKTPKDELDIAIKRKMALG